MCSTNSTVIDGLSSGWRLLWVVLLCACSSLPVQDSSRIVADLDADGRPEHIRVDRIETAQERGPLMRLSIAHAGEQQYSGLYPGWKLVTRDIDADGKSEVIIALSKVDYRDRQLRNRLYVYQWDGDLQDKWRGSRFPRAFIDFRFVQEAGANQAVLQLLEIDPASRLLYLGRYRWLHFGFAKLDDRHITCSILIPETGLESWFAPGALEQCGRK